jgi:hypothetical protein
MPVLLFRPDTLFFVAATMHLLVTLGIDASMEMGLAGKRVRRTGVYNWRRFLGDYNEAINQEY